MSVLVIEDHPLMLSALAHAVRSAAPGCEIIECHSMKDARPHLDEMFRLSLIVLDLRLPGVEGFSGLHSLAERPGAPPVVIVSASDDQFTIWNALRQGAAAFLPKSLSFEQMATQIRAVMDGKRATVPELEGEDPLGLTPIQRQVLEAVGRGKMNKQIAFELGVQESTIKWHLTSAFRKLGVTSRTQAIAALSRLDVGQESGPGDPPPL